MADHTASNSSQFNALAVDNIKSKHSEIYSSISPCNLIFELYDIPRKEIDLTMISLDEYFTQSYSLSGPDFSKRSLHRHNFFELMLVLNGSCEQRIETQRYTYYKGQGCLLNPNVRHVEVPTENCELVFLTLTEDFFRMLIENDVSV
ncbi:MAG: AraC family ligand binding domain-containing protein [Clostridiales bacterium]|nr:AraC family ligand binding domain-containing protein [Clostridiales bacterium]